MRQPLTLIITVTHIIPTHHRYLNPEKINGLYEPQLSAFKFSPLISHSKNQTYSLTNIYNNNKQMLKTISCTYAYATLFSLLFCDSSSMVSARDFQYATVI